MVLSISPPLPAVPTGHGVHADGVACLGCSGAAYRNPIDSQGIAAMVIGVVEQGQVALRLAASCHADPDR